MKMVPFTVHIEVVPERPGKRFEYLRSLSKISVLVYDALAAVTDLHVAQPGGGQNAQFGDIDRRAALGSYASGTAIKPQFGETPAQLMLTGFYEVDAENVQQWSNTQRFSGNEVYSGAVAHANDATPQTATDNEVKALKTALESAINGAMPAGITWRIFRLDYAGIVYGDRGFHFPR